MSRDHACGTVRDWMSRPPASVSDDCSIQAALTRMKSAAIRHLLVLEGDRLVGVVSNRDVRRLLTDLPHSPVLAEPIRSIMTEDPVTVAPETPVTVAARLLLDNKIGALPVRDGEEILGILTTSDALEALLTLVDAPER